MNHGPAAPLRPAFGLRLLVTLGVPLVLLVGAELLPLPGVSPELLDGLATSRAQLSIFALGVAPILSAYLLVELVAFFVPRWSRLRHDYPDGRQRLDAIVRVVALALAVVQAHGIALFLENSFDEVSFDSSRPVAIGGLVAGVMVQLWAAQLITRYGFLNGLVALSASALGVELFEGALQVLHVRWPFAPPQVAPPMPLERDVRALVLTALVLLVTIAATWIALRSRPRDVASKAHALASAPWVVVPSGSFQAYLAALSLVGLATMAPLGALAELLAQEHVLVPVLLAAVVLISWTFTELMHRPAELAPLVEQLGGKAGADAWREAARGALRAPLWPTLAFLTTVVLADRVSLLAVAAVVSLTAVAIDLGHAIRLGIVAPRLVPIWEERRIEAVPLLRAALAEAKIASETRGAYVLSLWQLFVPYAPVEILVAPSDAERARALLRALATETRSASVAVESIAAPSPHAAALRRGARLLTGCAIAAAAVYAASSMPAAAPKVEAGPSPVRFEIVRIDDSTDAFAELSPSALAEDGISIGRERTGSYETSYAVTAIGAEEAARFALQRLRARLDSIQLPDGASLAYGPTASVDEQTQELSSTHDAVRSYVLVGPPAISSTDIADAVVMAAPDAEPPEVFLAITLTAEGARRFGEMTTEWTQRRVAILVDGEIMAAPLVMEPITGGKLSLPTSPGNYAAKLAQAQLWERGLKPR